jgi:hypothetical protein
MASVLFGGSKGSATDGSLVQAAFVVQVVIDWKEVTLPAHVVQNKIGLGSSEKL